MPIRRRSAASDGPMLGNCSSVRHSAALTAFGALMAVAGLFIVADMRPSHQHVVADQPDGEAFELELDVAGSFTTTRRHDDGLEVGVLGDQLDAASGAAKTLDGDL